jgi:sugar phosphate isomerase/epimerase
MVVMRFGAMNNPKHDIYEQVQWFGENGFDYVDLTLEGKSQLHDMDSGTLTELLDRYHMDVLGHLAWYLPVASSYRTLQEAAAVETTKAVKFLRKIGAKWVCIHTQFINEGMPLNESIHLHRRFLEEITPICADHHMKLLVENTPNFKFHSIQRIVKPFPEVYLTLDIAHAHLADGNIKNFLNNLSSRIRHLHLSDNWGRDDQHLPLGAGNIDWKEDLKEICRKGYDGTLTLEIFSPDRDYLLLSLDKVKSFLAEVRQTGIYAV